MKDEKKTKQALIEELTEMRQEMEGPSRPAQGGPPPHPRQPRKEIDAEIEFIADFDLVRAEGIDLSSGGICFEVSRDLPFEMRFELEGKWYEKRANLVWVRRQDQGRYRLGFQFIPIKSSPDF